MDHVVLVEEVDPAAGLNEVVEGVILAQFLPSADEVEERPIRRIL